MDRYNTPSDASPETTGNDLPGSGHRQWRQLGAHIDTYTACWMPHDPLDPLKARRPHIKLHQEWIRQYWMALASSEEVTTTGQGATVVETIDVT